MVDEPSGAYLDHAAATPIDPRALAAMRPYLEARFGNPEGLHEWARAPAEAIGRARGQVAALIGAADADGVIFTAGDTEARNLAIKGIAAANRHRGAHLVISAVEHPATVAACRTLARDGAAMTIVPVDRDGRIDSGVLAGAVREDTVVVSIVHGQPEIGTVQDVAGLVRAVRDSAPHATVHVDAGATAGLVPVAVDDWGVDALSIGGTTLCGPRWAGALWVRPGTRLHPLIEGGLQEAGKRGGAEDVPGIAGLGAAAELAAAEGSARAAHMTALADRLIDRLLAIPDVRLNGPRRGRIPGHVQVSVGDVEGETLTLALAARGVAASPGSACGAAGKASPVLEAIGLEPPWTHGAVLLTVGTATTPAEVDLAADAVAEAAAELRAMSPLRAGA